MAVWDRDHKSSLSVRRKKMKNKLRLEVQLHFYGRRLAETVVVHSPYFPYVKHITSCNQATAVNQEKNNKRAKNFNS